MSQNDALAHGKLKRCQTQRSNTQITAEIMQTYDLQHDPTALISAYIHYEVSFINKSETTKKVKRPKSRQQMYKCRELLESVNSILRLQNTSCNWTISLGATASGICEGCCDWLIRGNKRGSGVGEKRCVTTLKTAAKETSHTRANIQFVNECCTSVARQSFSLRKMRFLRTEMFNRFH